MLLTRTFLKLGQRKAFIMFLQIIRFGKVPLLLASGSWLHVQEIFSEFAPPETGTCLSWLPKKGTRICLICRRSDIWQSGEQRAWEERGGVSPRSIWGLIPGTGIHRVRAQRVVQPSASSLHPSAPATFIALFCLFMVIIIYLPTC